MKEVRDGDQRPHSVPQMATEKVKERRDQERREQERREQERRDLHHLVTSSVPSPPFNGMSIFPNPETLTVFRTDPRAVLLAHQFASYAAVNEARFQIPLSIAVSSSGPQIYQNQATPPPKLDIISIFADQNEKGKKKKRGEGRWEETQKRNGASPSESLKDRKKERLSDNASKGGTIFPIKKSSKKDQTVNLNNNHIQDNLNRVPSNQTSRDKQFTCQVCNRGFGYKHVLQNHERTHTGEKPFGCTICQKRFTRDHHLKTHMRLHTGEKPYQCDHCERQFVQVANLRRHLRVHTGEKPYACEQCSDKFSDSNQLKQHILIHKGEKPYFCPECRRRFRRRHHLLHHQCTKDSTATPAGPKRERKPRETRRIIRMDSVRTGSPVGPIGFLPEVPEQTHPEDLSTHSLNFSSSHSSCSASPSPASGESHGSVCLYSVESSEPPGYSTDEDVASGSHTTGKTESDDASPSFI